MKSPNRPPLPWREIRELVRYLEREACLMCDKPHPAHIGNAARTVRQWLDPKPPADPRQMSMIEKW
jgi:hypothetical protein